MWSGGRSDRQGSRSTAIDDGLLIDIPVPVYLIRTDGGENALVDTGMHPAHIDDPLTASEPRTQTRSCP
jgi:hypothetical protein